jgi:DNA helicase-2/ATP-dependent DNA helicase PcrA
LSLLVNPKDDIAFLRVANVPPRGLGKTSLDHLSDRAHALGLPLLAMAREAAAVPGLKEKAARALRDFGMLIDELTALRDHSAEEVTRKLLTLTGYRDHLAADPKGGARTAWPTSTSWSRRPASSTASIRGPRSSTSWRRSA